MKAPILIFLIINLFSWNADAQTELDSMNLSIEYVVINNDTTYFDSGFKLPYKTNKELKKEGYLEVIKYKESTIVTAYRFRYSKKIISRIDLEFHILIGGKIHRRMWTHLKLYSKDKSKQDIIDKNRNLRLQNSFEIMEALVPLKTLEATSIKSAKIKINYSKN